ncbi:CHT1 [Mytilus edulis]|uniref:SLC5A7 n=1 Tax=Mytilus edulis TaxID=6550 RepID=A0A8S3RF97_MYTED|nr:CHT1 [Mytilus edulis]
MVEASGKIHGTRKASSFPKTSVLEIRKEKGLCYKYSIGERKTKNAERSLWAAWKSRKVTKNSEDVLLAGEVLVGFSLPDWMRQNGYATIIDPFQQKYGDMMGALLYIISLSGDWLIIPFAISNDAVMDLSTNYTDVWVKELDPSTAGVYIDGWLQMMPDWSMTTYMSGNSSMLADEDIPLVLPLVMEHLCPKAVALFGLGAVAAAVMSSVDSAVLSSSGQFSRNVYKRIIRKTASEREQIWVLRASTIVFGVIATSVSIYVRSIYALWVLCSDIIYVILFPQLTCAIYFSSANTYGSLVAFIVGLFFRVAGGEITLGLDPIIKYPWHKVDDDGTVVQLFPHKTLSMLLSLFSLLFVSWFTNWLFDNGILSPKFDILRKHSRTKYKNN